MFDLEKAAADWLEDLRRSRSLPEADVEALRDRLKGETGQLTARGLSAREAFYVGRSRVTPGYPLPEQCAKAGAREVWKDRFRWIGAGILAYVIFSCLIWLVSLAGTTLAASAGIEWNWLLGTSASLQIALAGLAFLIVLYVLPNARRLGIADAYGSMRRSWIGSAVLYVVLAALAVVLALGSSVASSDSLMYRFGFELRGRHLMDAYSETMAAHDLIFSLVFAVALVSILFVLGGRRKPGPPAEVQR